MRQLSEQIAMLVEESAARRRKRHQSGGHPQVAAQPPPLPPTPPGPGARIPGPKLPISKGKPAAFLSEHLAFQT
jgi:hypothetical protein